MQETQCCSVREGRPVVIAESSPEVYFFGRFIACGTYDVGPPRRTKSVNRVGASEEVSPPIRQSGVPNGSAAAMT